MQVSKIMNPKTGRWVKADGRVGKAVLKTVAPDAILTQPQAAAADPELENLTECDNLIRSLEKFCKAVDEYTEAEKSWRVEYGYEFMEYHVMKQIVSDGVVEYHIKVITSDERYTIISKTLKDVFEQLMSSHDLILAYLIEIEEELLLSNPGDAFVQYLLQHKDELIVCLWIEEKRVSKAKFMKFIAHDLVYALV